MKKIPIKPTKNPHPLKQAPTNSATAKPPSTGSTGSSPRSKIISINSANAAAKEAGAPSGIRVPPEKKPVVNSQQKEPTTSSPRAKQNSRLSNHGKTNNSNKTSTSNASKVNNAAMNNKTSASNISNAAANNKTSTSNVSKTNNASSMNKSSNAGKANHNVPSTKPSNNNKPVKVVLVRWPKGLERIDVTIEDTIGQIVDRMGKKFNFDGSKYTLIQESNNAKTARRVKLSQLEVSNGEIFRLDMPGPQADKNDEGFKPPEVSAKVQRFKSEWGQNAVCLSEIIGKEIVIEQQNEAKIKKVLLPEKECAMVAHVIEELHFMTMRIFFLYGTMPSQSVIRIHAISLPAQRYDPDTNEFHFNEAHKKSSDALAEVLGFKLLGVIIPNDIRNPQINPSAMLYLSKMAKQIGENFIVCAATPDAGKCVFEMYQFSNQFLELSSQGFFTGVDGKTGLKAKKNVYAYTKLTDTLAVEYFLVNVASVARESWFPRARFPFQAFYPTVSDFAYAMNVDYQSPDFIRLLDFNLLLFLEQYFNPGNEIPMIARNCIAKKKSLPFAITSKLEEIIASAALVEN